MNQGNGLESELYADEGKAEDGIHDELSLLVSDFGNANVLVLKHGDGQTLVLVDAHLLTRAGKDGNVVLREERSLFCELSLNQGCSTSILMEGLHLHVRKAVLHNCAQDLQFIPKCMTDDSILQRIDQIVAHFSSQKTGEPSAQLMGKELGITQCSERRYIVFLLDELDAVFVQRSVAVAVALQHSSRRGVGRARCLFHLVFKGRKQVWRTNRGKTGGYASI